MRFFSATPLVLLVGIGLTTPAIADQLQMPAEETTAPQQSESMDMPLKGMSKEQVKQMFGKPNEMLAPVGDPPITRWVYERYTVYFEYSYVIHSVVNK